MKSNPESLETGYRSASGRRRARLNVHLRLALGTAVVLAAAPRLGAQASGAGGVEPLSVVEATVAELQAALTQGRTTSRELVLMYLTRIATFEDRLNAVITVNPRALAVADSLDRERAVGRVRGPLHGIPVALKDNIHTVDLPTTGGALAFEGLTPPYDATLTENLRDGGAIILAKTTMTELANWVTAGMPGNYSALGGYGMNPYDPRRDPRPETGDGRPVLSTGGSSSGVGTAASFWAANVGTETSGSILSPANANMLVGIKPTVGRISRWGVIPITADQDTPGPMARTVGDAALVLGVLESGEPDPNDPATGRCPVPPGRDYTAFLDPDALRGARIGVPRAYYYDSLIGPDTVLLGGLSADRKRVIDEAVAVLRAQGAVIVDPADIPSVVTSDRDRNILLWPICADLDDRRGLDDDCSIVLKYGMKRDFERWLLTLGERAPVRTLLELREWNEAHAHLGAIKYGQARLDISDEIDVERDRMRYEIDRARDIELVGLDGIDEVMENERLDALLFPGSSNAALSAKPGYPTVTVPFGRVDNPAAATLPEGFDSRPAPFGVSFAGRACDEPRLIALAYAFEQATLARAATAFELPR